MNLLLKCAFGLIVLASLFPSAAYVLAQENKRLLDWMVPPPKDTMQLISKGFNKSFVPTDIMALELLEVSLAGKPISVGQEFFADDDWIGNLTFRLKNTSQKPILSIRMGFLIPETYNGESNSGFSLTCGKEFRSGKPTEAITPILPGDEIELTFTEARYKNYLESIAKRGSLASIKRVTIGNVMIYFDDGTIWTAARLQVQRLERRQSIFK